MGLLFKAYLGLFLVLIVIALLRRMGVWPFLWHLYAWLYFRERVARAFERPSEEEKDEVVESGKYVARKEVDLELLSMFRHGHSYGLVYGENEVGKTTSIKHAIKMARREGIPVLYFSASSYKHNVARRLAYALRGFDAAPLYPYHETQADHWKKQIGVTRTISSIYDFTGDLSYAADFIKRRHGKRPVLVIDQCEELEENPEGCKALHELQQFAKSEIDHRGLIIIFVASKTSYPKPLMGRGMWRMSTCLMKEMSRAEADEYLRTVRGIEDEHVRQQVLDVAGHSFDFIRDVVPTENIERLRKMVDAKMRRNFDKAGLEKWAANRKLVAACQALVREPYTISEFRFRELGLDNENNCLENVFSTVGSKVSFRNAATRRFVARQLNNQNA